MTFCLPVGEVVRTNRSIVGAGLHQLTGLTELESALARPLHTMFGELLYPTMIERAGALLHGLVNAHAFFEGNKRTAWISTVVYVTSLGGELRSISQKEASDFVVGVAVGAHDQVSAARWLATRLVA